LIERQAAESPQWQVVYNRFEYRSRSEQKKEYIPGSADNLSGNAALVEENNEVLLSNHVA